LPLKKFYAALTASTQAQHDGPVRVLWFGDSHTAADYMTDRVRRGLQERFGSGGPGFVRVGLANYRHAGLKVTRDGPWRIEPHPPARRSRQDDGVFGLGGLRAVGEASARARLELTGSEREGTLGKARFELLYDVAPGASIELKLGEKREIAGANQGTPPIRRLTFEGDAASPLELLVRGGTVKVWGVIIERINPGVVLDTLGIDGARIATALGWDKDAFVREVAARKPELGVIAYGTNEAFDNASADRYAGELAELVGRLREAQPGLDCVIVAPPDAGTPDGGSPEKLGEIEQVQREAARSLGCGFFSQRAFMGGAGSYWLWLRETPPLARPDRLHYSPKGYERLGEGFVNRLLAAYDAIPR
jgi:lysophospholipase L1-like esterase